MGRRTKMPVSSGKLTIGTAAVQVPAGSNMAWTLHLHNNDNSDALFVGGPGVTASTGMQVNKIERAIFEAGPLERFYVVSSKATHVVSFLAITQDD
jgi:hypothetical protein